MAETSLPLKTPLPVLYSYCVPLLVLLPETVVKGKQDFDKSMAVCINGKVNTIFSLTVCRNLIIL